MGRVGQDHEWNRAVQQLSYSNGKETELQQTETNSPIDV